MASTKEIQNRIKSIKDTMKITNAMYMISSSKLKKAKKDLENTEPYFYTLQVSLARLLRHLPDMDHLYFENEDDEKKENPKRGYIVVTADKGMAGAYNYMLSDRWEDIILQGRMCRLIFISSIQHRTQVFTERGLSRIRCWRITKAVRSMKSISFIRR